MFCNYLKICLLVNMWSTGDMYVLGNCMNYKSNIKLSYVVVFNKKKVSYGENII